MTQTAAKLASYPLRLAVTRYEPVTADWTGGCLVVRQPYSSHHYIHIHFPLGAMGVIPPPASLASLPIFSATTLMPHFTTVATPIPSLEPNLALPAITNYSATPQPSQSAAATLFPIPESIVKKILRLEYVDMAELKPNAWLLHSEEPDNLSTLFRKKKEPVTDILVWVQCFSAMVAILAQQYPAAIPHLMAYQSTIVKCAKRYDGLGWVAYDMQYRRTAAQTKSLNWGVIDQSAYAEWFTGSSKTCIRCSNCLEEHSTQDCPQSTASVLYQLMTTMQQPQWQNHLANRQGPLMSQSFKRRPQHSMQQSEETQICGLFNSRFGNRCTLAWCTYRHICAVCGGNHSKARCQHGQSFGQPPSINPPPPKRFNRGRGRGY